MRKENTKEMDSEGEKEGVWRKNERVIERRGAFGKIEK